MALKPDALQLGFLKVLHGTQMEAFAVENNWKWMDNPPYETFSTPYMSYDDMMFLKDVEVLLDAYWNSESFEKTMNYIGKTFGFWNFFSNFAKYAKSEGVFVVPRRESFWFEFLAKVVMNTQFAEREEAKIIYELLRFDFICSGKKGGFPNWYKHNYDKDFHRNALEQNGGVTNARLDFAYSDYDEFCVNPFEDNVEWGKNCSVLFMYQRKNVENSRNRQILLCF